MEYGELLRRQRVALGLRIEDVANAIDRPSSFVWRIENGKNANPPDPQTFRELAGVLQTPVAELLEVMGYLEPIEADDSSPLTPVERHILIAIRSYDWTPEKVTAAINCVRAVGAIGQDISPAGSM